MTGDSEKKSVEKELDSLIQTLTIKQNKAIAKGRDEHERFGDATKETHKEVRERNEIQRRGQNT